MRSLLLTALTLSIPFLASCSSETAKADTGVSLQPPKGLEDVQLAKWEGNELTAAKAELGKVLFFDPRLSASGKMGCVDCHHVDKAFTDGIAFSTKDNGGKNTRNSPTMFNVGYYPDLYWDGRKQGLEANILAAWTGQLGGKPEEVAKALNAVGGYQKMFQTAFGGEANEQRIVQALASFLRTLRSGNSAVDRGQLSDAAKAGEQLFTSRLCAACHAPPLYTDRIFHNVGIGMAAEKPDLGREAATKNEADRGRFKTPSLRDVARTAPYFHDGSVATLKEAVKLMASGGHANPNLDPILTGLTAMPELTDEQVDQLVAFLESLNGDVAFTAPKLPQ